MRALSLLVYAHVSPYGTFDLNLDERLDLARRWRKHLTKPAFCKK